jgi:hypothetical protein
MARWSGADRVELLRFQLEEAWTALRDRVEGLTDDEYLWEPVPGCWTVHRDEAGRWVTDYAEPDPDPAPFTTIAWRLVHVADCKVMYHEWAFGDGRLGFDDLAAPPTVAGALQRLDEGQAALRAELESSTEPDLDRPVLTNWGEEWPAWRIFTTMIDHDRHHGAEVGCLRDLYRCINDRA